MHLPAWSSLPNTHYRVCVKGIMFNEVWELFVLEENDDPFNIDLPGGGLDHWEVVNNCLQREIEEEIWCRATIQSPICTRTRLNKNWVYYFFVGFSCNINLDTFRPSEEASNYKFVSKDFLQQHKNKLHRLEHIMNHYDEVLNNYRTIHNA